MAAWKLEVSVPEVVQHRDQTDSKRYFSMYLLLWNLIDKSFMAAFPPSEPMTSPSSDPSSSGLEPQLPPLLPPLRSTEHLHQPFHAFPGAEIVFVHVSPSFALVLQFEVSFFLALSRFSIPLWPSAWVPFPTISFFFILSFDPLSCSVDEILFVFHFAAFVVFTEMQRKRFVEIGKFIFSLFGLLHFFLCFNFSFDFWVVRKKSTLNSCYNTVGCRYSRNDRNRGLAIRLCVRWTKAGCLAFNT